MDLRNPDFQPLCREVDLTGFIITVTDEQGKTFFCFSNYLNMCNTMCLNLSLFFDTGSSPAFYLADERLNFIKIRCFSSFAQSGVEDIVKPRVLLALSNLQLRGQSMYPTPVVYAGDLTVFSTNPKEAHLQKSLSHFRDCVQVQSIYNKNVLCSHSCVFCCSFRLVNDLKWSIAQSLLILTAYY